MTEINNNPESVFTENSDNSDRDTRKNPTISLRGFDSLSIQLTAEKIKGKNYREWTQSIKLVINDKGKLGYLIGETEELDSTHPVSRQKWNSENFMIRAWLVHSMIPSIGKAYLFLPTTKDIWEAIRKNYSDTKNFSQIFEIKTQLWQMKQGNREVTDYYMEMVTLWKELDLNSDDTGVQGG